MLKNEKIKLREKYKAARSSVSDRQQKQDAIDANVISHPEVQKAELILCYYSIGDEISTRGIIAKLLEQGKKIALPRCEQERGKMNFYYYTSDDELLGGRFGLREPNPELCKKVEDFGESICIVPALAIDKGGYRLGYGGGYYDRFLANYRGKTMGLIFDSCLADKLPRGRFDIPVDFIITESRIVNI